MNSAIIPYLIVCPLIFLSALVDAIGGGGGLISLPAYLLAGLPPHMALGSNKFSAGIGMISSTTMFIRGGYVRISALLYAALSLVGAAIGARLTLLIDEKIFRWILLAVLPLVAVMLFRSKRLTPENNVKISVITPRMHIIASIAAFFVGMYDGFYGPGTGTFLLLLLSGPAGFDLLSASGTTKVINFASNIGSLCVFLLNGKVVLPLAAVAAIFSLSGQYVGSKLIHKNGARIVKPVVSLVLCLLAVKLLSKLLNPV